MTIDRHADTPAYKQLAALIREQIVTGTLAAGDEIPSRTVLAQQYNLALRTVGEAMRLLVQQGLVIDQPGKPYRVRPTREDVSSRLDAAAAGVASDIWDRLELTRAYETVPSPVRIATALGVPQDTPVVRRRWVHTLDGTVTRVNWSYLVEARFGDTILCDINEPPWPGGTIAQLKAIGYHINRSRMEIRAREATNEELDLLRLESETVVLETFRTHLIDDQPVECAIQVRPAASGVIVVDVPLVDASAS